MLCVCVCVSDEGHVNYLSTDLPCHCQIETVYPSNKAALMFHSLSRAHTHTAQHTDGKAALLLP